MFSEKGLIMVYRRNQKRWLEEWPCCAVRRGLRILEEDGGVTGVLYHNPERLRMVKKFYDALRPGGALVLESATIRRRWLRHANCVEVIYPPSVRIKRKYHLSQNITHVPSAKAIASLLAMVGYERNVRSGCHRKSSAALAGHRVAYLATKPLEPRDGRYYSLDGDEGFVIGRAL